MKVYRITLNDTQFLDVLADTFSEAIEKIVKYLNEQGNEVSDEVIQNIQVISEPIDVS